jgi:hypothetical protein
MARGDYTPEIKAAVGTGKPGRVNTGPPRKSPGDVARSTPNAKAKGPPPEEPAAMPKAMQRNEAPVAPGVQNATLPHPTQATMPHDAHHVAAATSIAHAILGHRNSGAV